MSWSPPPHKDLQMVRRNPDHAKHDSYQSGEGWHLWSCDGGALSKGPSKVSLRLNGEDILLITDLPSTNPPRIQLKREHLSWLAEVIPQAMGKLAERDNLQTKKDMRERLREKIRCSSKSLMDLELELYLSKGSIQHFLDGNDMPSEWLYKVSMGVGFWDFP